MTLEALLTENLSIILASSCTAIFSLCAIIVKLIYEILTQVYEFRLWIQNEFTTFKHALNQHEFKVQQLSDRILKLEESHEKIIEHKIYTTSS
jgi:hypothetical protein